MNVAAFLLLAAMLGAYVILDGYDLGVGAIHLLFSRSERGRSASFEAIGPFWNGNEVFLIAGGAVLFALFPRAYAAAFSGFYLPFIIVLWLLMVRGMSIELRGHFPSDLWRGFWDVAFCISSALLALLFGVALGNIVRGVPLDPAGYFSGTFGFLLNWYAIGVGVLSVLALSMHGAAFLWMRTQEEHHARARQLLRGLLFAVIAVFVVVTVASVNIHRIPGNPAFWIAPAIAILALAGVWSAKSGKAAIASSGVFLLALMASAAQTIFPYLLPAVSGGPGLDIYNSAPMAYSVGTAFTAALIGFGAVLIYGTLAAVRMLRGEASRAG